MYKKLFLAAFVVAISGMVGVSSVNATNNNNHDDDKVTICHRTNATNNPYVRETVSESAVDGKGHDDHTSHTGPVASSEAVAVALKAQHKDWGDIIPYILNWTTEGKAVYNNDCKYPKAPTPTPKAVVGYALVCDMTNKKAVITFTNTGNAAGSANVNGTNYPVAVGSKIVEVPTATNGTQVKIVINDKTVFDQLVVCEKENGNGNVGGDIPTPTVTVATPTETPTVPAVENVASLPYTAGDNTQAAVLVASVITTFGAIVGVVVKTVLLKQS